MIIDDINKISNEKFKLAKVGKKLYRRIHRNYLNSSTSPMIFVFSDDDDICNYYGLLYLNEFLDRNSKEEALILTNNDKVERNARLFSDRIKDVIKLSDNDTSGIISLYCLKPFDGIVFISLSKPEGRTAFRLIGINDLTKEILVAVGIYFIIPFKKIVQYPEYNGSIQEDLEFMGCNK